MNLPAIPLKEFDLEMASTRRLLERVPTEKGRWKPHQKSFPLGHLAQLVSSMPGWIASSLREAHIDLATAGGYSFEPTETLLRVRGHLNHLIHHRGQLTVYLRLVDVPLPPIYGPTADERA
jgi:hypothetical protein